MYVSHSQSDQQVDCDDGHDDTKDEEEDVSGGAVGETGTDWRIATPDLVTKEDVVIVELPEGHHHDLGDGTPGVVELDVIPQKSAEAESKSHNKDGHKQGDSEEGEENIGEHDNVDAQARNLSAV